MKLRSARDGDIALTCAKCGHKNAADFDTFHGECCNCYSTLYFFACPNLCSRFTMELSGKVDRKLHKKTYTCDTCYIETSLHNLKIMVGPSSYAQRISKLVNSKDPADVQLGKNLESLYSKPMTTWTSLDRNMDGVFKTMLSDWNLPLGPKKFEFASDFITTPGFENRWFGGLLNKVMDFEGIKLTGVSGHWRTSSLGNVHWVRSHTRQYGSFYNFMNFSALSLIAFPLYFFYFQHHWGVTGWRGHLLLALLGSLFADVTLLVAGLILFIWVLIKICHIF